VALRSTSTRARVAAVAAVTTGRAGGRAHPVGRGGPFPVHAGALEYETHAGNVGVLDRIGRAREASRRPESDHEIPTGAVKFP